MSKKQALTQTVDKKAAVDKFIPSTGDESYLQGGNKMKGDAEKKEWETVRALWSESRHHAEMAVSLFMDMGDILLTLREGKTDPMFGKLRKVHVPELTRQDATRAMNLARNRERFMIDGPTPSISVYAEMVHSSDELVEEVLKQTADPVAATPTVKEVREKARAEKKPESAEDFAGSIVGDDKPDEKIDEPTDVGQPLAAAVELILEMPHSGRIKAMSEQELDTYNAFLVLGFNPLYDGDYPCSRDVFKAAIAYHLSHCTEEEARITNHCANMLELQLWN